MRMTERTPEGVQLRAGIACAQALDRLAAAEDALDGLTSQLRAHAGRENDGICYVGTAAVLRF